MRRGLRLVRVALIILPIVIGGLWLGSGRETLTKPFRSVEVEVQDDLFGGTNEEYHPIRGPVLGYFIGLDAVIVTSIVSAGLLAFTGWSMHRQRNRLTAGDAR